MDLLVGGIQAQVQAQWDLGAIGLAARLGKHLAQARVGEQHLGEALAIDSRAFGKIGELAGVDVEARQRAIERASHGATIGGLEAQIDGVAGSAGVVAPSVAGLIRGRRRSPWGS